MLLLSLLLLLQGPTEHEILEAEHARTQDVAPLLRGIESSDLRIQRLAIRAIGRLERPALRDSVVPLLRSTDAGVRREAVAALAQMGAAFDFASLLPLEKAGGVRAVVYESMGRAKPGAPGSEARLVTGLTDEDIDARTGAARGLETLVRLNIKSIRPAPATIQALRRAVRDNAVSRIRQFALLALNTAGDQDAAVFDAALLDADPQVRRLAVIGSKRWVDDPSPIVRFEAIRLAGTCARALAAVEDESGHVALAAIDFLGASTCDAGAIEKLVDGGGSWRVRARALVSLARVSPEAARVRLPKFRSDAVWQVRAYAASAAVILHDEPTLTALSGDVDPNVAASALTTVDQAVRALASDHAGLLLAAAARLKGAPQLSSLAPRIVEAIERLSGGTRATVRDQRVQLIELLREAAGPGLVERLRPLLADRDPSVASLVAKLLSEKTGQRVTPKTDRYVPAPFPSAANLRSLVEAKAFATIRGLGTFTIQLLPEEAPATVATFVELVEKGAYNGLTFHRVVPNFVLQGGSPGADEYDALTDQFMRDEVGFARHERGTLGISTRGHDTGDGQIFINLIDNWRLDHAYTVFARVSSGMDVIDRILEGDVIESLQVRRSR